MHFNLGNFTDDELLYHVRTVTHSSHVAGGTHEVIVQVSNAACAATGFELRALNITLLYFAWQKRLTRC